MSATLRSEGKQAITKPTRKNTGKTPNTAPVNDTDGIRIPFSKLFRSPLNVRRTVPAIAIEELADNLKAVGLIQSLVVVPDGDRFGVVAGGRRFLAMSLLVERGDWTEDKSVLCRIVTPEEAEEISLAENVQRHAMHPADQFEAFARQVELGRSVEQIAQRFGVSASIVAKRLKLASVSPAVMSAFRQDQLTLEQVSAFTVADDHEAQDSVLQWVLDTHFQVAPHSIKNRLMQGAVPESSRIVSFVGLDTYRAAGGTVVQDLFGENGFLTDTPLLHELAEKKLGEVEAGFRAEGWSWVERITDRPSWFYSTPRLSPKQAEPTAEDAARIEAIADRLTEIEENEQSQGLTDEENEEYDALTVELEALQNAAHLWSAEQKEQAGVFIMTEGAEIGTTYVGVVKPGAKKKGAASASTGAAENDSVVPTIPNGLMETLYRERTAALQATLARDSVMVLRVLVHAFLMQHHGAMSPRFEMPEMPHDKTSNPAICAVAEYRLERLNPLRIPQDDRLWPWLLDRTESELVEILAACALPFVNAGKEDWSEDRQRGSSRDIAASIGFDMREWWKPDADNFFRSLTKSTIADYITEAGANPGDWQKAKRDALAADATKAVAESGWLPAFLRTPGAAAA